MNVDIHVDNKTDMNIKSFRCLRHSDPFLTKGHPVQVQVHLWHATSSKEK